MHTPAKYMKLYALQIAMREVKNYEVTVVDKNPVIAVGDSTNSGEDMPDCVW